MRIIVTGSRAWTKRDAVFRELTKMYLAHGEFCLVHGDCSTGADSQAHDWFTLVGHLLGCTEETFPAAWETRGRAAGPERNIRMVQAGANLCLAFPLSPGTGTQQTMKLAEQAGIKVIQIKE